MARGRGYAGHDTQHENRRNSKALDLSAAAIADSMNVRIANVVEGCERARTFGFKTLAKLREDSANISPPRFGYLCALCSNTTYGSHQSLATMKRPISEVEDPCHDRQGSRDVGGKRRRIERCSILALPSELLLRTLLFLDIRHLVTLDLVSRKFRRLSTDSGLWKQRFYEQWIEPRARRIPQTIKPSPSNLVWWLEHGEVLREGATVDWKRRYRLRSNWEKGEAHLHEVEIATPPTPPVLARVSKGLIFTADAVSGLRVWSHRSNTKVLEAHVKLRGARATSMAVDGSSGQPRVAVGFEDGNYEVYVLDGTRLNRVNHESVADGSALISMAMSNPYLVVMTKSRHIHVCQFLEGEEGSKGSVTSLVILHADSPLHPAALSLRCTARSVIATIAYAFSRLSEEWCLGLQEVKLSRDNGAIESRTASNIETPLDARYKGPNRWDVTSRSAFSTPLTFPFSINPEVKSPPTSLSYSHPFLLASLSDNTIMSYLVQSDDEKLEISSGRRLFGHTSAITSAEVSNRGKAVSISARGDEIRLWELEEMLTTVRSRPSTQVRPRNGALDVTAALAARGSGLGLALQEMQKELAMTRRWVSFDDEQVVVLGERDQRQILACYDFGV